MVLGIRITEDIMAIRTTEIGYIGAFLGRGAITMTHSGIIPITEITDTILTTVITTMETATIHVITILATMRT
ncbi:hypothetical protein CAPN009_10590 [Capnocytophaga canimorsus]|nr:hypothetical protein CAPN007_04500 [Capnocytophaga canimorsus]GJQ04644.1 hypothetical protein CAPN009_10590 [Capnocytophaga canimorsus]